jgi:microcystin-dependent protein
MDPFIGEIKLCAFGYAPRGWAQCNGQIMAIAQNQALFSLLGTVYGGNGQNTFGLPDLQGRVALHAGTGFAAGQTGGEQGHTLTQGEIPAHTHQAFSTNLSAGAGTTPSGTLLNSPPEKLYTAPTPANLVSLGPTTLANAGGSQAHENRQPYTVVNFCIALQGIFPSRN